MNTHLILSIFNLLLGATGYLMYPNDLSAFGMLCGAVGIAFAFHWRRR
jgi:hypothetical protein